MRKRKRPLILVVNDDGIDAPGLKILINTAARIGCVRIVAPRGEASSTGDALKSDKLSCRPMPHINKYAFETNGTPADCVSLGLFFWKDIDMVLSGINIGYNLGPKIWHSGTVAAIQQAALLGRIGFAVATSPTVGTRDLRKLSQPLHDVLRGLLEADIRLANINIPPRARRVEWARQDIQCCRNVVRVKRDKFGVAQYSVEMKRNAAQQGTDEWWVERGVTSITPLRIDLTDVLPQSSAKGLVRVRRRMAGR